MWWYRQKAECWQRRKNEMRDYTNSEVEVLIDELIHSERDRALMKRRLIDGLTQEQLAEEFDLSVRQVQRLIYKLQEKILLS
jgi:DNA-directed RNA polymerase specialized sigma24 family protein